MDKFGDSKKSFFRKGIFPYRWAFTLLFPLRNFILSPKKLISRLPLARNSTVLEVGPGPGYFSTYVALAIPEGKLVLADIQQEMLDKARRRLEKRGISNVQYHKCDGKCFPFESSTFDVIFLVAVIGEVMNRKSYVRDFLRMLIPGGIVSISELWGDSDHMSIEETVALFEGLGFKLDSQYGSKSNFTLNFRKL